MRQRFAQHLAPQVVKLIVADPNILKLTGERREITALFTDIEGFTTMTDRLGPQELVSILDRYFDGVAAIVIEHGGMVDKMVGDAVHAFFNAPFDRCPLAVRERVRIDFRSGTEAGAAPLSAPPPWARRGWASKPAMRSSATSASPQNWTTRRTATHEHGRAVEGANKEFGPAICIGAGARIGFGGVERLKPPAKCALGGLNTDIDVYTPK